MYKIIHKYIRSLVSIEDELSGLVEKVNELLCSVVIKLDWDWFCESMSISWVICTNMINQVS